MLTLLYLFMPAQATLATTIRQRAGYQKDKSPSAGEGVMFSFCSFVPSVV